MSKMSLTQAADEVRKILRGFRAVEQVSEALEQVGSIENAAKEAQATLAALNVKIEEATAALKLAEEMLSKVKDDQKVAKDAAKKSADAIIAKAEEKAAQIVAETESLLAEKLAIINGAEVRLAGIAEEVAAKQAEVADLDKRIDKAKSYLGKLVATVD
jgi:chromosome segregation ATPase